MRERWTHDVESNPLVRASDERDPEYPGVVGPVLFVALLAILWGGAYLLARDFWGTVGWVLLALTLVLLFSAYWQWMLRLELRQRRRVVLSQNKKHPYVLLLRSSAADRNLSPQAVYPSSWSSRGISDSPGEVPLRFRFRAFLEQRLRPYEVFAVKNHEEFDTLIAYSHPDGTWAKEIVHDIEAAAFVVLVPIWLSPGLILEIDELVRRRLLGKVLIALPPCFRGEGRSRRIDEIGDHFASLQKSTLALESLRDDWNRCAVVLKDRGIQLPFYPEPEYLKDPSRLRAEFAEAFRQGRSLPKSIVDARAELEGKLVHWRRGAILSQSQPGSGQFDTLTPWDLLDLEIAMWVLEPSRGKVPTKPAKLPA